MDNAERELGLVAAALDDFDTVPLAASVRRALRIARLRGDAQDAWLFAADLRPIGGSARLRIAQVRELWPEADYETVRSQHSALLEEWMLERKIENPPQDDEDASGDESGKLMAGSVEQVERRISHLSVVATDTSDLEIRSQLFARIQLDEEVLARIRHRTFVYLCRCERELAYGAINTSIFERHRLLVDNAMRSVAPDVLEQFNAAYRRVRDGDDESLSQALTSCRRILKAVADVVFPPQDQPIADRSGVEREAGNDQFINRLWLALERATEHKTARRLSHARLDDIGHRLDRLNELASKGVHDDVTAQEVDLCVIETYLIAGEVLALDVAQR